jgi:hypothetical protein
MVWYGLDRIGSGSGPVEGSCERGNKPSGSIKCCEVLAYLHSWRLLKKGSAPQVSKYFYLQPSKLNDIFNCSNYGVLLLLRNEFMQHFVEMASGGMIYIPSFMTISWASK